MTEIRVHHAFVRTPTGERLASQQVAAEQASGPAVGELLPVERELAHTPTPPPPALDHVDLVVHNGETVAVVGPSGCGKTTLLRTIAGLQPLVEGEIWFDDREVTHESPSNRGIGMVFQNYALYPHMESRGNLGFFFKVHHREREIDERVREVAAILGVGFNDLLDRRPRQLSGGEKQRVAIGRCIVRNPAVFLFDEPLSNLDAKLRQATRLEIKRLLRRFGISALYVTHDQTEALALGDRIALMRHGRIAQAGTYHQLHDDPESLFVATFLGSPSCNVLPGVIEGGVLAIAGRPIAGVPAARRHSGVVAVGIRPEALTLATEPADATFQGTVDLIEHLPSERARWVTIRAAGRMLTARLERRPEGDVELHRGDHIGLDVAATRVLLFDPSDGRRLRG